MISSRTSEHILSYTSDEGQSVGGRSNEQHGAALTVIVESPVAMKDALAVLPEDLRAAIRVVLSVHAAPPEKLRRRAFRAELDQARFMCAMRLPLSALQKSYPNG